MKTLILSCAVLVVLAMVTGSAFAVNEYQGADGGTWFNAVNWSDGVIPNMADPSLGVAQIKNGNTAIMDSATVSVIESLDMGIGGLQVGTLISNGDAADVTASLTMDELKSVRDASSDVFQLDIVNGTLSVTEDSEDQGDRGTFTINVGASGTLLYAKHARFGLHASGTTTMNVEGQVEVNGRLETDNGDLTVNLINNATFVQGGDTARISNDESSTYTIKH